MTTFVITPGFNSSGPFGVGGSSSDGNYATSDNTTFPAVTHSVGSTSPNPGHISGATIVNCGVISQSGVHKFTVALGGTLNQNFFKSIGFADNHSGTHLYDTAVGCTYDISTYPGITLWSWVDTHYPTFTGVPVTMTYVPGGNGITDILFNVTGSLLHMDNPNGSAVFDDSGRFPTTVSVTGTVVQATNAGTPTGAPTCADFGAGAGYLVVQGGNGGPNDYAQGDFTIEGWFNTSIVGQQTLFRDSGPSGGVGVFVYLTSSNAGVQCQINGGAYTITNTTSTWAINTWYHVAISKRGAFFDCYINGVPAASGPIAVAGTLGANITTDMCIGGQPSGASNPFNGLMQDFRITKGVGRYLLGVGFTPTMAPYGDGQGTDTCNADLADEVLLLEMQGVSGGGVFTDSSPIVNAVTVHGAVTTEVGSETLYGTSYGEFASGYDYLSIPMTPNGPMDLHQSTFTVEGWCYPTGVSGSGKLFSDWDFSHGDLLRAYINQTGGGGINFQSTYPGVSNGTCGSVTAVPYNQWSHWAVVIDLSGSGTQQCFLNGVGGTLQSYLPATTPSDQPAMYIGWDGSVPIQNGIYQGGMVGVRIHKGVAKYNADFVPVSNFWGGPCGTIPVPDVIGEDLGSASSDILAAFLTVGTVTYETDPTTAYGLVNASDPAAGTLETPGTAVDLTVSTFIFTYFPPGSPNVIYPEPVISPFEIDLSWSPSTPVVGSTPPHGYQVYRGGVLIGTTLSPNYEDNVPGYGIYVYSVVAWDGSGPISPSSRGAFAQVSPPANTIPNSVNDEGIGGAYFGGVLNLKEFVYYPTKTPNGEVLGPNMILNRYKQQPTDNRQRGVDYKFFLAPGERILNVSPAVVSPTTDTPLVVSNIVVDPLGQKFGYNVTGGIDGIQYIIQFTVTTQLQTRTDEEIFQIAVLVEDQFPSP